MRNIKSFIVAIYVAISVLGDLYDIGNFIGGLLFHVVVETKVPLAHPDAQVANSQFSASAENYDWAAEFPDL